MFQTERLAVYMDSSYIGLIIGNNNKIKYWNILKTPEGSITDGKIVDVDALEELFRQHIKSQDINAKDIMFSISGSDIVIRQTEIPVMDEENIRNTVTWEMNQYLPQEGQDHYIDFEILEKNAGSEQKTYKVLVVAAPKEKIESYLELSQRLNLKLKAIDVSANCVARIFKTKVNNISNESLGVINIGSKNSNIILVENGKLFMEREVPFGTENVIREISRRLDISQEEAEHYLYHGFSFKNINEEEEIQKRIQTLFDNVFSTFQKVIQFYTNGKVKKNLDGIYFSNLNNAIDGLEEYISSYFSSPVYDVNILKDIRIKTKVPVDCDLRLYTNVFGLMLRKE